MLEQESDWVELFSQEITKTEGNIDPFHILVYEISVEFVVSANMNISLGCDFWYENAKVIVILLPYLLTRLSVIRSI
jgi:hypothetical protein